MTGWAPEPVLQTQTNPCDPFLDSLQNDQNFISNFSYLNSSAIVNLNIETGFAVSRKTAQYHQLNGASVDYPTINFNAYFVPCVSADGIIHCHFGGLNAGFSADDIAYMAQTFMTGQANNPSNLFMGIATGYGPPYLIKVTDTAAFRTFATHIIGQNFDHFKEHKEFLTRYNQLLNTADNTTIEQVILNIIKKPFSSSIQQAGFTLYRGNGNCNKWSELSQDEDGNTVVKNCF